MAELPKWMDWTIDVKLRQFRKVGAGPDIKFVDFDSPEGREVFKDYAQAQHDRLCDEAKNAEDALRKLNSDDEYLNGGDFVECEFDEETLSEV